MWEMDNKEENVITEIENYGITCPPIKKKIERICLYF